MVWLLMFPLIEGITHRGIILSILIFIISLSLSLSSLSIFILSLPKSPDSSQPFPYSNTHFRSSRPCPVHAIVEMSSATFACILTGCDEPMPGISPTLRFISCQREGQNRKEGGGMKRGERTVRTVVR